MSTDLQRMDTRALTNVCSLYARDITVRPVQGGPWASSHNTEVPSVAVIVSAWLGPMPRLFIALNQKGLEGSDIEFCCLDEPINDDS